MDSICLFNVNQQSFSELDGVATNGWEIESAWEMHMEKNAWRNKVAEKVALLRLTDSLRPWNVRFLMCFIRNLHISHCNRLQMASLQCLFSMQKSNEPAILWMWWENILSLSDFFPRPNAINHGHSSRKLLPVHADSLPDWRCMSTLFNRPHTFNSVYSILDATEGPLRWYGMNTDKSGEFVWHILHFSLNYRFEEMKNIFPSNDYLYLLLSAFECVLWLILLSL